MYLLGLDLGSSSIKAALVNARTGATLGTAQAPETEMDILALQPDWAEQAPETWWANTVAAVHQLLRQTGADPADIAAIGISYQMHGLVTLDADGQVLRPAIIWCDSRAVATGEAAAEALGKDFCRQHYLNTPGNFTASKLKWVRDHEPELFARIRYILLPGDYLAYRLSGEALTTVSGLSEGILWDFQEHRIAGELLVHYGIPEALIPPLAPTFGPQGRLSALAAAQLGLKPGVPLCYRAGDQPNNALALNVLQPGEVAATGGTSGVVYGVVDQLVSDPQNRVNSFAHVNHSPADPRIGVLLCINGSGILYRWLRQQMARDGATYAELERLAATAPLGADELSILPFGNGAERMLGNRHLGAHILNLNFNRHQRAHLYRAGLEGVAFSFVYGMKILQDMGLDLSVMRAGNDNLFQSALFSTAIAELLDCRIEMWRTTGAVGAALAAGAGMGLWSDVREGLGTQQLVQCYEPQGQREQQQEAYARWAHFLEKMSKP
ncbi:MAG: carbohydrate kinase [Saprospiraceae bacterium]|nr:carbohydrate kinase [Saprospiraceae bacterium]